MCYISKKIEKIDQNKTLAYIYIYVCVKDGGMLLGFVWQEIADTCWTLQMCCNACETSGCRGGSKNWMKGIGLRCVCSLNGFHTHVSVLKHYTILKTLFCGNALNLLTKLHFGFTHLNLKNLKLQSIFKCKVFSRQKLFIVLKL